MRAALPRADLPTSGHRDFDQRSGVLRFLSENDGGVSAAISCLDRGTREGNIPMGGNGSLWSGEKWSVCHRLGRCLKQGAGA